MKLHNLGEIQGHGNLVELVNTMKLAVDKCFTSCIIESDSNSSDSDSDDEIISDSSSSDDFTNSVGPADLHMIDATDENPNIPFRLRYWPTDRNA